MNHKLLDNIPESDFFQVEWILDDASGGDPHSENILLGWKVVWQSYPVYVRQVTETSKLLLTKFKLDIVRHSQT